MTSNKYTHAWYRFRNVGDFENFEKQKDWWNWMMKPMTACTSITIPDDGRPYLNDSHLHIIQSTSCKNKTSTQLAVKSMSIILTSHVFVCFLRSKKSIKTGKARGNVVDIPVRQTEMFANLNKRCFNLNVVIR